MAALPVAECVWCDNEGCEKCDPIQVAFEAFHAANPQVYDLLVQFATEWREARPNQRVGIARLVEAIRWDLDVRIRPSGDGFKINNNFRSRYARLIMARNPSLQGIFEVRELR